MTLFLWPSPWFAPISRGFLFLPVGLDRFASRLRSTPVRENPQPLVGVKGSYIKMIQFLSGRRSPAARRNPRPLVGELHSGMGRNEGCSFFLPEGAFSTSPKLPVSQYSMVDAVSEIWTIVSDDTVLVNRVWFGFHGQICQARIGPKQ